jgi:hypothetical protein
MGVQTRVFVKIAPKVRPGHPKKGVRTTYLVQWELSDLPNLMIKSLNVHDDAQECMTAC